MFAESFKFSRLLNKRERERESASKRERKKFKDRERKKEREKQVYSFMKEEKILCTQDLKAF